jgi:hypothetical protein
MLPPIRWTAGSQVGYQEKATTHCDQVLEQGKGKVGNDGFESAAVVIAGEGARYRAQSSKNRAQEGGGSEGNAYRRTASSAEKDADAEGPGLSPGRDERQLVGDQFAHGEEGKNHQGDLVAKEGEQRSVEVQPAQMSAPGDHRWSSHRAQTTNGTQQEGVEEDHHGSTMACAQTDVKRAWAS